MVLTIMLTLTFFLREGLWVIFIHLFFFLLTYSVAIKTENVIVVFNHVCNVITLRHLLCIPKLVELFFISISVIYFYFYGQYVLFVLRRKKNKLLTYL